MDYASCYAVILICLAEFLGIEVVSVQVPWKVVSRCLYQESINFSR